MEVIFTGLKSGYILERPEFSKKYDFTGGYCECKEEDARLMAESFPQDFNIDKALAERAAAANPPAAEKKVEANPPAAEKKVEAKKTISAKKKVSK